MKDFVVANAATSMMLPMPGKLVKAATLAGTFAPGAIDGIKTNLKFGGALAGNPTVAPFGNFFYGATAAAMGSTLTESLAAGAVVQQWTNYLDTDPRKRNVSELANAIYIAIKTGRDDNVDDAYPITGGDNYCHNIYKNDSQRDNHENSCNSATRRPAVDKPISVPLESCKKTVAGSP